MWARTIELMLGCWLIISPFVFGTPVEWTSVWANDMVCGFLVITFALLSYAPRLPHAHLFTLGVSVWLVLFGYFYHPYPTPPAMQNDLLTGLVLMMFAIVPTQAQLPPSSWQTAPSDKALLAARKRP